jgi:hypothetical protein
VLRTCLLSLCMMYSCSASSAFSRSAFSAARRLRSMPSSCNCTHRVLWALAAQRMASPRQARDARRRLAQTCFGRLRQVAAMLSALRTRYALSSDKPRGARLTLARCDDQKSAAWEEGDARLPLQTLQVAGWVVCL